MASLSKFRDNPVLQKFPKSQKEWLDFVNEASKWIADSIDLATTQTDLATTQTVADNASSYFEYQPGQHSWTSDNAGVFPAGNPTRDLTITLYDKDGTQIAQRVLRGTLTSAAGTIAVTNVSSSGLTSAYALTDDGTDAPKATVTFTFANGSKVVGSVAWLAIDTTTASSTPGTGGGK